MPCDNRELQIFSGNANPALAKEIVTHLGTQLGKAEVSRFPDGELHVEIDENVRGQDVFVIQPTCHPVHDHLMELLVMIDALHRASAERITAVIPYYSYARQDRKTRPREPITAKLVANLLVEAGAHRILTMDLHAGQIQGFFDIPVDHLEAAPILADYFKIKDLSNAVVVSPDVGGTTRARNFAGYLNKPIAIIDKYRASDTNVEIMHIVGNVQGKTAIIVDDMIDTAGSIIKGSQAVLNAGAREIFVCATHPIFADPARERLEKYWQEKLFMEVVVTNTIPIPPEKQLPCIKVLSVSELFSEAIKRIHYNQSISALFR
ncbi:MAG: ribose-phosphate pyrophosphokinase [Atribacterota bacterium]|nr:ribose-phosphate pyrophosphokinase [Atribacterota bacterium]MDD5638113.1 ribose-phosphate pyrophosphokinase [Atribacterota bacterium]